MMGFDEGHAAERHERGAAAFDLAVEPGTRDDYARLAAFHYRGGPPATVARVLRLVRADERGEERLAGVLVASYPTLNGAWREIAWPGVFRSGDKSQDARALNEQLRTISRVVIDPRYRGAGSAVMLVRAYLAEPLTARTEAIAAMGRCCPFFASAGMRAHEAPRPVRDERLARTFRACGLEAWRLLDVHAAARAARDQHLSRAVLAWARANPTTRGAASGCDARRTRGVDVRLVLAAAAALSARPMAYVWG